MNEGIGKPENDGPLVLDLKKIVRNRLPKKVSRILPGFFISVLERLIRQKELNDILRVTYPLRGSEFSKAVLRYLDISLEVEGLDRLPDNRRFMFASNHPLGGLDGIALIAILGEKYGDTEVRFLVNDMLMNVEPLRDVFLPVNKFGGQGKERTKVINEALASDKQILQFPAGLVSRLHDDGTVSDLEWQKAFVTKALEYERDIVPVRFIGSNTGKFYKTARLRKKLGLKFNAEQILLPSEVCKSKGNKYKVIFGSPVSFQSLKEDNTSPKEMAARIREKVYSL